MNQNTKMTVALAQALLRKNVGNPKRFGAILLKFYIDNFSDFGLRLDKTNYNSVYKQYLENGLPTEVAVEGLLMYDLVLVSVEILGLDETKLDHILTSGLNGELKDVIGSVLRNHFETVVSDVVFNDSDDNFQDIYGMNDEEEISVPVNLKQSIISETFETIYAYGIGNFNDLTDEDKNIFIMDTLLDKGLSVGSEEKYVAYILTDLAERIDMDEPEEETFSSVTVNQTLVDNVLSAIDTEFGYEDFDAEDIDVKNRFILDKLREFGESNDNGKYFDLIWDASMDLANGYKQPLRTQFKNIVIDEQLVSEALEEIKSDYDFDDFDAEDFDVKENYILSMDALSSEDNIGFYMDVIWDRVVSLASKPFFDDSDDLATELSNNLSIKNSYLGEPLLNDSEEDTDEESNFSDYEIEQAAKEFIASLPNDEQLDPDSESYLGYINFDPSTTSGRFYEVLMDIVKNPGFYRSTLADYGLEIQGTTDIDELIIGYIDGWATGNTNKQNMLTDQQRYNMSKLIDDNAFSPVEEFVEDDLDDSSEPVDFVQTIDDYLENLSASLYNEMQTNNGGGGYIVLDIDDLVGIEHDVLDYLINLDFEEANEYLSNFNLLIPNEVDFGPIGTVIQHGEYGNPADYYTV